MREKIKLESSAGTGHFYTTTKNKKTKPEKLEMMKYDPVARLSRRSEGTGGTQFRTSKLHKAKK